MEEGRRVIYSQGANLRKNIYYIFSIFLICAFAGWVFETSIVAIARHTLSERGYLFVLEPLPRYFPFLWKVPPLRRLPLIIGLPLIEIYGFGGLITILGFRRFSEHPIFLFLAGAIILTGFELLGSYFCTEVLHRSLWDYSKEPLNFQGRISLASALCWGAGSVLSVKVLAPLVGRLYRSVMSRRAWRLAEWALMAGALLCALSKYWWFADILDR